MKIYDMFQKDIDRQINGVIKVMQTDDENRRQELEEYVITRELRKHFGSFYDHYEQSVDGATDQMGVWISGFFGSGKSHFLKILSYLLANEEIGGKRAIDYFEDKFSFDPLRYAMMRRVSEVPTETILFNIDAKSPMGKDQDAILRVFTKVFYEHCGYYGDDMKVAALERFLDRQGRLEAFKAAFEAVNTEPWATAREAFAFWEDDVVAALTRTAGMSENAARNWFNGEETAEMSIERLGREIAEYVDGKAPNFHLVFLVDEIGQYIGDNSGMMLNLQTLACYLLTSAALLNAPEDAFAGLPGAAAYAQQAYALVSKWLHEDREAMLETCRAVEERYPVMARLQKLDRAALLRVSVYPCADALLIRAALTAFAQDGMNVDEVQGMMQARRELPWWGLYAPYADALGALCEMQLFIRAYRDGFHFTDAEEMFAAYASRLCRMDTAYRHLCAAADRALALGLFALEDELKAAVQAAERLYKNGCLAPLGVCWSALLAGQTLETALAIVPRQERFYADHVRGEDARTFVIVSDALRYEVAQELTERLHGRLSGNTVCTAMVGTIPTITPVGMAALLPHKKLTLTEELSVLCDGMRTDASQREAVLRAACPQSAVLELGVFRRMTRAQRQEIAREAKVVYLYQDVIDRAGESDGDVFAACETAMSEIEQAMRWAM